jgi:hypothetical protein
MAMMNGPPPRVPAERAETIFGSDMNGQGMPNGEPHDDPDQEDEKKQSEDDAELLREAREFLDYADSADSTNRNRAQELLEFCYVRGKQWPDKVRRERESDNRPCLEFNQMPSFVNQIANDERQNRPSIKVRGASDDATAQMATIRQDLIRHIEYESAADQCYDTAFRYAVAANMGYWRVVAEYEREDSFNQVLRIKPIKNIFSVYYDPDCVEPDGSDAEKVIVAEDITHEEFDRQYPDHYPIDFATTDPLITSWIKPETVRLADYYHRVYYEDVMYLLHDGKTAFESELGAQQPEGAYQEKRVVERCKVAWERINGIEVLERHEWPGKYIPIIPVWGDQTVVDGEVVRHSLLERAQDSQQMYNFWLTTASEAAALQPKAPFIVAEGQIAGHEQEWGKANTKPYPYLTAKRYTEEGKDLGIPQRSSPDIDVTGMLNQAQLCLQNMRQVIGIADPLQNMQIDDSQSGRAILAKERVASTATFHFVDNLSRAIRFTGKVLLDLIPSYYDAKRTVQLLREDGEQYKAILNGDMGVNDMSTGEYDCVVDAGPSYASKRVEFVNSAMELAQSNPQLFGVAGDLIVKNMDWPGAEKIADRLYMTLPPQVQALDASKDQDPKVVALGQQLQQLQQQGQQQMQAMGGQMQKLQQDNEKLQSQVYQAQMRATDAESRAKNTMAQAQADIITQQMESADVQSQEQNDRMRLAHDIKADDVKSMIDFLSRVVVPLVTAQQKQMQPIGPELNEINRDARGVAASDRNLQ